MPFELISLLGGWIVGFIGKIHTQKMEQRKLELQIMMKEHEILQDVRNGPNRGWKEFQWTRRVIALTVVFMVFVFPKLMYVLTGDPIIYTTLEEHEGFLFFSDTVTQHVFTYYGLPITPLDTHAAMAIFGLYFGKGK